MAYVATKNALTGDNEKVFEPNSPILTVLSSAATATGKSVKYLTEGEEEDLYKALYHFARATPLLPGALGGGLPWPEFAKWIIPQEEKESSDSDTTDQPEEPEALPEDQTISPTPEDDTMTETPAEQPTDTGDTITVDPTASEGSQ